MPESPLTRFRHPGARLPLLAAGYIRDKVDWCRERRMDAYALVHLLGGSGRYVDQNGELPVRRGDTLLLFPGFQHSYGPDEAGEWWEGYLVFWGETFVGLERDGLLNRGRAVLHSRIAARIQPEWSKECERLIRQHSLGHPASPLETTLALHSLLHAIVSTDGAEKSSTSQKLDLARGRLEQNLDRDLDVKALCHEIGLGYESFRKHFAEAFGLPPSRYRLLRRLDRVKTLLAENELTLSGIASAVGFCDEYHLSRQFKHATGISPRAYRASVHGTKLKARSRPRQRPAPHP